MTSIFVSQARWEDIRPSLSASPEPFFIERPVPPKEGASRVEIHDVGLTIPVGIQQYLLAQYPANDTEMNVYHSSLLPLYNQFTTLLLDIVHPFTSSPTEIQYISAATWPGFVNPIASGEEELTEQTRMRLLGGMRPLLRKALEELYPRQTNALDWAIQTAAATDVDMTIDEAPPNPLGGLPRTSKFILIASHIASSNPAKTDLRMFGRGLDEKKHRRRIPRKQPTGNANNSSKAVKIPQQFLGPSPFPLDRLLAILSALIEENDPPRVEAGAVAVGGETDLEVSRCAVYAAIVELAQMRLLVRTSASDRIDGPPMFKCGVSYEMVLGLAREVKVPLNDLLWDPM